MPKRRRTQPPRPPAGPPADAEEGACGRSEASNAYPAGPVPAPSNAAEPQFAGATPATVGAEFRTNPFERSGLCRIKRLRGRARALETHGKPVAFYSDKHGIFRVNAKDPAGGDGATQFGRALIELNIDILCANSPQAKGRVERAFETLQDRLAKELRLAGISTVEAANAWLAGFIEDYNQRFGRAPANAKDLHRPLTEADDLDEILAWREARSVTRNLTLRYDRMMLLLEPTPFARGLAGKKVEVVNYPDGRFAVRHEGVALPFRVFDKIQTVAPGAIVENKRLGAALAFARERQASYPPNRRRGDPRRQRPPNNLEAPGVPTKGRPSRKILAAAAAE